MRKLHALPPTIALVLPLTGTLSWAEEQPQFLPARDVDITYDVRRPGEQMVQERVRWLARERLERIDGPEKTVTIIDQRANEVTLLNYASGTYSQVDGASPWPVAPPPGVAHRSQGEPVVADVHCTDWSWADDVETRVACMTADGVVLRLVIDGKTSVEARLVSYAAQDAEIFLIPPGYVPAVMAPTARKLIR